jgi:WD40 repeat protein
MSRRVLWCCLLSWLGITQPASAATDRNGDPLPPGARARLGSDRFRSLGSTPGRNLVFSPDRRYLASANDNDIVLHEAETGRFVRRFVGHTDSPLGMLFFPDGKTLVSSGKDGTVRFWRVATGKEIGRRPMRRSAGALALSGDGKTLAVSRSGSVSLWDVETRRLLRELLDCPGEPTSLGFSGEGRILAVACCKKVAPDQWEGCVLLYDTTSAKLLHKPLIVRDQVHGVSFLPRGKTLLAWTAKAAHALDGSTGKVIRTIKPNLDQFSGVALSPDGTTLATAEYSEGDERSQVRLHDLATGRSRDAFPRDRSPWRHLAFSADGKRLAGLLRDSWTHNKIRVWDLTAGKEVGRKEGHEEGILSVAVTPDGEFVATAGKDGTMRLWESATGRQVALLQGKDFFSRVAFAPDGKTLAVSSGYKAPSLRLLRIPDLKEVRRFDFGGRTSRTLLFTPDGRKLVAEDGEVRAWDVRTGRQLLRIEGDIPGLGARVALTPDGRGLIAANHTFARWDLATGKLASTLGKTGSEVGPVACAPDGTVVATGSYDEGIRLHSLETGKVLHRLLTFETSRKRAGLARSIANVNWVYALAFSPDGRTLASASSHDEDEVDCTIRLWEVATGLLRRQLCGHRARVSALAFAAAGATLVSASRDCTGLVWDIRLQAQGRAPEKPSDEWWSARWLALAEKSASDAFRAQSDLAAAGDKAAAWLAARLSPVRGVGKKRLAGWIEQLADDDFHVREEASKQLARHIDEAELQLRRALDGGPDLEQRTRIERLLALLALTGERLRAFRTLEVLEDIDSSASRALLEKLAKGAPDARFTREAKASQRRLSKRAELRR